MREFYDVGRTAQRPALTPSIPTSPTPGSAGPLEEDMIVEEDFDRTRGPACACSIDWTLGLRVLALGGFVNLSAQRVMKSIACLGCVQH